MSKAVKLALAVILALGLLVPTVASASEEVTMTGKIVCAKCTLHKADAKACQDVFVSKDSVEYYISKNDAAGEAGHACGGEVPATVTGTVTEQDGRNWIATSSIKKG